MYIPKRYLGKGKESAIAFMKRFNFGTIVTTIEGVPQATHLPFEIAEKDDKITLTSHFAVANEHWKHIVSNENLIIFSEPHAYVSPRHYDKKENVPTWNYLAVHAYGRAQIISEQQEVFMVLERMMNSFDPAYKHQWESLPMAYKTRMAKGIVAFEIEVNDLQSKEKLSQNKKENERRSIIESFANSKDANENIIAEYMSQKEDISSKQNQK